MAAPRSLKFLKLKRRLALPHWQVVGLLESLWLFTQTNAAAGDIGRHSDEDIAAGIEWAGDPGELIDALVNCRWLDRCDRCRLVVHDWEDHAPNHLKGNLAKLKIPFAEAVANSNQPSSDASSDVGKLPSNASRSDHPYLSLPNLTLPLIPPNPPAGGECVSADCESAVKSPEPEPAPADPHLVTAIAEASGLDPTTAAKRIRTAAGKLAAAQPPFTTAEVAEFATRFWELCPWAALRGVQRPTPSTIAANIGLVRAPNVARSPPANQQRTSIDAANAAARAKYENGEYRKRKEPE